MEMNIQHIFGKFFITLIFMKIFTFDVLAGPNVIPFTGQVEVSGDAFSGTGTFRFAIVNSECVANISGCQSLWSNDGTSTIGSEPASGVNIAVDKGFYNIGIGNISVVNMTEVPLSVFDADITFLRVWFDDGSTGSQLLTPDRQLVSVPYAYRAKVADSLSANSTYNSLPVGAVIDWWRPSDSTEPVPDGFAVCDGSVVSDTASPFNGKAVPDLTDTFVRGVTDVNNIGDTGGALTHSHTTDLNHDHATGSFLSSLNGSHSHNTNINHNHPNSSSVSGGSHNHSVSLAHNHASTTSTSDSHNHVSFSFNTVTDSWSAGNGSVVVDWGDGMDSAGTGNMPISLSGGSVSKSLYTSSDLHNHNVDLPNYSANVTSSTATSHAHNIDLPALGATHISSTTTGGHSHSTNVDLPALGVANSTSSNGENLPPYYGLLKLIKIK